MSNNLEKAKKELIVGKHTCVMCKDNTLYTSDKRGVAPLISWLDSGINFKNFSAADKVVGKAAAFLYVLLGVKEVYAEIISEPASETLDKFGISQQYATKVNAIRNRTNTGFCPMETTVLFLENPEEALKAIINKIEELRK